MELIKTMLPIALVALSLYACGGAVEDGDPAVVDTTAPNFIIGDPEGDVIQACSITAPWPRPSSVNTCLRNMARWKPSMSG